MYTFFLRHVGSVVPIFSHYHKDLLHSILYRSKFCPFVLISHFKVCKKQNGGAESNRLRMLMLCTCDNVLRHVLK